MYRSVSEKPNSISNIQLRVVQSSLSILFLFNFLETGFHYPALADLELAMYTRLASNS